MDPDDLEDQDDTATEEDVATALEQDPDVAYLLDDNDQDQDQDAGEDDAAPKGARRRAAAPANPLDDATQQILNRLKSNPEAMDRLFAPSRPAVEQPPARQEQTPAPRPAAPDLDAFAEQFERDLMSEPRTAVKKLLGAVGGMVEITRREAIAEVERRVAPAMHTSVDSSIREFVRELNPKVYDNDVKLELNRMIELGRQNNAEAISRMTPQQLRASLQSAADEAYGKVAIKRATGSRPTSGKAPQYGAGSSSRPAKRTQLQLTAEEKGFISNLRAAGLSDKDIKESLREFRAEKAG